MNVSKEHHLELAGFSLFTDFSVEQYDGEINTIIFLLNFLLWLTHMNYGKQKRLSFGIKLKVGLRFLPAIEFVGLQYADGLP